MRYSEEKQGIIFSHEKKFREINSFVTSLKVKLFLSRNFYEKVHQFHEISFINAYTQCGNVGNLLPIQKYLVKSIYSVTL